MVYIYVYTYVYTPFYFGTLHNVYNYTCIHVVVIIHVHVYIFSNMYISRSREKYMHVGQGNIKVSYFGQCSGYFSMLQ